MLAGDTPRAMRWVRAAVAWASWVGKGASGTNEYSSAAKPTSPAAGLRSSFNAYSAANVPSVGPNTNPPPWKYSTTLPNVLSPTQCSFAPWPDPSGSPSIASVVTPTFAPLPRMRRSRPSTGQARRPSPGACARIGR
ncbi:hypothetical protein OF83DRAFT_1112418 [Amylostereum chailletii]|nr:hypothetical protein OF83DRAFT_1112418 [Amylostereum chailletii]